jgi:hypothetical protein
LIQYSISSGSMSSWTLINSLDYFLIWRKSNTAYGQVRPDLCLEINKTKYF